jgi:hypothetical protein
MIVERTSNEFVIRFPISSDMKGVQDIFDYLRYKELTACYETEQSAVDTLAKTINKNWWSKNKHKFNE